MGRRSSSPRMVGRDRELADLLAAIRSEDAERPIVLIAGEAGLGKTRLLAEAASRLAAPEAGFAPAGVVRGSCLLPGGEVPFAPIIEILDRLRELGAGESATRLRGKLAGASGGPASAQVPGMRAARFLEISDALVAAAKTGPLVVLIDDLHWADRSTLDLVLFLARSLRGAGVVLVVAYRSDELHRRHPLRPVVAELARGFARERIELGPLGRDAVMEQIREIGGTADPKVVGAIVQRADGNPFYVEELVSLGTAADTLPPSVRGLLLARFASLDPTTLRALSACAVVGHDVDDALIGDVIGVDRGEVRAALAEAIDHGILVAGTQPASVRFRHALLEEAAHDDLSPGERVDLHRRVVDALAVGAAATGMAVPPSEVARHQDLGGRPERAFDAYLDAATVAYRALAWAEGVSAYERAAALAAMVADTVDPGRLRELVIPTALAMTRMGFAARAIALLRTWLDRTDAASDPTFTLELWLALTKIHNDSGDEASARTAGERAEQFTPDPSTPAGIDLLIHVTSKAWLDGHYRRALEFADPAVDSAERLGDLHLLFLALVHRSEVLLGLGHLDRGMADIDRARALQAEHGWLDTYGHFATNVAAQLTEVGLFDEARALWEEALAMSQALGTSASWDPWNLPGLGLIAFHTGRWADADGPIERSRAMGAVGMPRHLNETIAAALAAGRGDLAACDAAIAAAEASSDGLEIEFTAIRAFARALRAEAAGEPGLRLAEAEDAIRLLSGTDNVVLRSRIAVEAAAAAADLVDSLHPRRDEAAIADARARGRAAARLAAELDAGVAVPGSRSVPWTRVNAGLASAEADRADGADAFRHWPPLAGAFREIGLVPRAVYVDYRGAAAALAGGDRETAGRLLRGAAREAATIGMHVLAERIEALARAGRIRLDVPTQDPAASRSNPGEWGLSARELEVLALVAEGRTNGQIGARLFISPKTASVHVTHILDKLGVSSRTEAALLASRAGLVGPASRSPGKP